MQKRKLGKSNLEVSALGFGGIALSEGCSSRTPLQWGQSPE
jgi:aryl-alcohol dehydrogenase-like predicted oxidoreductase